jgi:molecular chaperone GrpE
MALFKRGKSNTDEVEGDSAESTIEVKASVIADAIADADRAAASPRTGIASDGLVSVGDMADDPAEQPPDPRLDQALAERKVLVQLCLYALDRARSPGVVERLEEGLAGVGVTSLRPDGIRFDPAFHEAGGTVATADEELDGVVAETEVVGFSDRGEVMRPPIVTVYSKAAP